jgi:lysozyme
MPDGLNAIVDVSHLNGNPDFVAMKDAGVIGVIHKATQGVSYSDPTYGTHKDAALAAGLLWGAYHFSTGDDGVAQADYFLSTVGDATNTVLVLDFEANPTGPSMSLEEARAFVTHVNGTVGRYPGLYAGHYLKEMIGSGTDSVLASCWFWLSQYGPTAVVPANWDQWTMWQYTDGAANAPPQNPISDVWHGDRNTFNGDEQALRAFWGT